MSKHFNDQNGDKAESILKLCQHIACLPPKQKPFNVFAFVQGWTNRKAHPGAICESLEALSRYWHGIQNPYGYINRIMRKVNGTYNEADAVRESERFKQALQLDDKLKAMVKDIGKCKLS